MLRISNIESITDGDIKQTIPKLVKKIEPILQKRRKLHEIYTRKADDTKTMFSGKKEETVVTYEKFLTDIASGYLSGKPVYSVAVPSDDEKKNLLNSLLDKPIQDETYKDSMQIIVDYITGYNDDEAEHHDFVHDILELTGGYEVLYENEDNEIVYARYSALNTIAIWDYEIPANIVALVRVWEEKDIDDKVIKKCEITDKFGTKTYSMTDDYQEVTEKDNMNHNWGDVPAIAVETDFAIFEPCEDVVLAFEQLIQNIRNTYQYNDTQCKLKFSNYIPNEPLFTTEFTTDESGNQIESKVINEARKKEDQYLMDALTIYVQENGDVDWITKPLDSAGAVEILQVYTNLMFQLAGIPNTSDLAFNSADLNASAIDRKFYIMNMMTANVISQVKKAYQRRWELIFNRINLKKGTQFDFRDIDIDLPKNLPANDDEKIDSTLKLTGVLSEQTIIERLGYDYIDEKNKKDSEIEDNMMKNLERMAMIGGSPEDMVGQMSPTDAGTQKTPDELFATKQENDAKKEKEAEKEEKKDSKDKESKKSKNVE